MSKKAVPNGDMDFVAMAESFARTIAKEPARYQISEADSAALSEAVAHFRQTLQVARGGGSRSESATAAKDEARGKAKRLVRRLRNLIRGAEGLDAATKVNVSIQPRTARPKMLPCPKEPPRLRFTQALHKGNGATPMHELEFHSLDWKSRPPGAVRLELFVDLIPPDEPIPEHPGQNHGSRPWYLRSYTRSPIRLTPPMARVPMRVVYWGRWADSTGEVGPFSATAVAWIEGGSPALLPGGVGMTMANLSGRKQVPVLDDRTTVGPAGRDEKYRIALLEVQIECINPQTAAAMLPEPEERPMQQLEGPPQSEAA